MLASYSSDLNYNEQPPLLAGLKRAELRLLLIGGGCSSARSSGCSWPETQSPALLPRAALRWRSDMVVDLTRVKKKEEKGRGKGKDLRAKGGGGSG